MHWSPPRRQGRLAARQPGAAKHMGSVAASQPKAVLERRRQIFHECRGHLQPDASYSISSPAFERGRERCLEIVGFSYYYRDAAVGVSRQLVEVAGRCRRPGGCRYDRCYAAHCSGAGPARCWQLARAAEAHSSASANAHRSKCMHTATLTALGARGRVDAQNGASVA